MALNIINQPKPTYVYKIFTAHVILVNIDLSIHSTIETDIYMTALSPDLVQTLTCTIFMDPSPLNEMMWSCKCFLPVSKLSTQDWVSRVVVKNTDYKLSTHDWVSRVVVKNTEY